MVRPRLYKALFAALRAAARHPDIINVSTELASQLFANVTTTQRKPATNEGPSFRVKVGTHCTTLENNDVLADKLNIIYQSLCYMFC